MSIKERLKSNICVIGDEEVADTNWGKKAKKNIDNFGFKILIKKPLVAIFVNVLFLCFIINL